MAVSLLASGGNFYQSTLFSKFLKLPFLSSSSFTKIQRRYVIPAIEEVWENHQGHILEEFRDKDVVILGKFVLHLHVEQYSIYLSYVLWIMIFM